MHIEHCRVEGPLAEAVDSLVFISTLDEAWPPPTPPRNHFPAMGWCVLTLFTDGTVALPHATRAAPAGQALPRWMVSGPRTRPVTSTSLAPLRCLGVVLYPDAFARLTGVAPASLQDEEADAGALLPDEWSAWPAALGALAGDADAQQRWIVDWLAPRWQACREDWAAATPPGLVAHLRRPLIPQDMDPAPAGVAELAELLALGERQLRRHMQAATGLSPVQWQRIQRASGAFIKARDTLAQGQPLRLAELAAEFGYADQAHLTRELQALCGLPAARLLQAAQHAPDYWPFRL